MCEYEQKKEREETRTKSTNLILNDRINNYTKEWKFRCTCCGWFFPLFKFFEHVHLEQQAYFSVFHSDHVLCNQMYIDVRWHNDVVSRIDHHNGNQNLREKEFVKRLKMKKCESYQLVRVSYCMYPMNNDYVFSFLYSLEMLLEIETGKNSNDESYSENVRFGYLVKKFRLDWNHSLKMLRIVLVLIQHEELN